MYGYVGGCSLSPAASAALVSKQASTGRRRVRGSQSVSFRFDSSASSSLPLPVPLPLLVPGDREKQKHRFSMRGGTASPLAPTERKQNKNKIKHTHQGQDSGVSPLAGHNIMSIRTPYYDLLKADRRALASLFARFRTICKYRIAWLVLRWVTMWESRL